MVCCFKCWCDQALMQDLCRTVLRQERVQAVKTHPLLPPLISPIILSLFPMTSKTFPQLPRWLHPPTPTVSSAPVTRKLCIYDRKRAKDESVTHHSRELLFALQRTLLINEGLWLQTVAVQPQNDTQENKAPLRDFWSCQSLSSSHNNSNEKGCL